MCLYCRQRALVEVHYACMQSSCCYHSAVTRILVHPPSSPCTLFLPFPRTSQLSISDAPGLRVNPHDVYVAERACERHLLLARHRWCES